jgi:hypothetical protein
MILVWRRTGKVGTARLNYKASKAKNFRGFFIVLKILLGRCLMCIVRAAFSDV